MKGVIVAAGYGMRFLPLTKTLPKEMLPLYDKPLIDFILDEFEDAGINDVIVITSRRKKILEDYLDREVELESVLKNGGKSRQLESIKPRKMNFIFIRQQEMKGTGHALLLTKSVIGNEPFIVAYPDDIVLGMPGISRQMMELYNQTGKCVLAVRKEELNISRYGVVKLTKKDGINIVGKIVEKPDKNNAPSNLVSIGRYLFTPEMLSLLEAGYLNHKNGEYYHIDSINALCSENKVAAMEIKGLMLDTGEPQTYLTSLLLYIKQHPQASDIFNEFVKNNYKS